MNLAEKLQLENNAFNAVVEELKRDMQTQLSEANERARKAEKAFVDLTRRRATLPEPAKTQAAVKPQGPTASGETPKRPSTTVSTALASIASPYRSCYDRVLVNK